MEAQQLVSAIQVRSHLDETSFQAFNGALQSIPAIIVAFFAGPLSDKFSRKPFIIFSLIGYIILNTVFLVNSYWFYELKVVLFIVDMFHYPKHGSKN